MKKFIKILWWGVVTVFFGFVLYCAFLIFTGSGSRYRHRAPHIIWVSQGDELKDIDMNRDGVTIIGLAKPIELEKGREIVFYYGAEWSDRDKAILNGVKYYHNDRIYYYYENCLHFRNEVSEPDGLTPKTRMVWAMVCNSTTEVDILENGKRQKNVSDRPQ